MSKSTPPYRYSLALIAGVATAVLLMVLAAQLTSLFYPESRLKSFDRMAVGPQLLELLSWMIATFGGGLIAAKLAKDYPLLFCSIIGAILSYPLARNILATSGRPNWFVPACAIGMPLMVLAAWQVAKLRFKREQSTATQSPNG